MFHKKAYKSNATVRLTTALGMGVHNEHVRTGLAGVRMWQGGYQTATGLRQGVPML